MFPLKLNYYGRVYIGRQVIGSPEVGNGAVFLLIFTDNQKAEVAFYKLQKVLPKETFEVKKKVAVIFLLPWN